MKDKIRVDAREWQGLNEFPIPDGAIPQTVAIERDGFIVVYGLPHKEHNCDEMGCPTTDHVLYVKKIRIG